MKRIAAALAASLIASGAYGSGPYSFEVNAARPGAPVPETMYGIFFEDINFAADGGLYAELIKNRSFEFPDRFMGWDIFGNVKLMDDGPFERNPHYVRISGPSHREKRSGIENRGFFGIGYSEGAEYRCSFWARMPDGGESNVHLMLCDPASMDWNQAFSSADVKVSGKTWKKYEIIIKSSKTVAKGSFRIMIDFGSKPVDMEHVSLFPADTWNGHENGMRKDLAQALAELKPGVFRFPGGCIVEGTDLETRYQWKNTVGPVENRPLNENRWNYTFAHRLYPDYFQSYGLGFYEYFLLSEEIGAEPLPVLNVGLSCEFQNGAQRSEAHVDVEDLQPYIDDVLDLIEFANGDPLSNKWAALRAEMGHPKPFGLKYVGIGNEQWGEIFSENLKPFVEQVRAKYPEIKIIGSAGPSPQGEEFDRLWTSMTEIGVDLVDEHYYCPEEWFAENAFRYDKYPRKNAPKVFAGEYACHAKDKGWNHFEAAIYEAALMTGLERNADIVEMATYAPLFAHIEGWQWRPDLIWFDNLRSFKSCSYYIQQVFSLNKGDKVLPINTFEASEEIFASAVSDGNDVVIKIVNTSSETKKADFRIKGFGKGHHSGSMTVFSSKDLDGENTLEDPEKHVPVTGAFSMDGPVLSTEIPAKTFMMYRISK